MDRIGILIDLMGKDAALSSLNQLLKLKNEISRDKVQLKIDAAETKQKLVEIGQEMRKLKAEKTELTLGVSKADLSTFDNLKKKISETEREISRLEGNVKNIMSGKGDTGDLLGIQKRLVALREELTKLKAERVDLGEKIGGDKLDVIDAKMKELSKDAEDLKDALKGINLDSSLDTEILGIANDRIQDMTSNAISLQDALEGVASAMNGIGDVFGDIASIGSGFGDMLGQMAGLFSGGGIVKSVSDTLVSNATNAVTSRLGDIISRYDTMKTFIPYMKLAGVSESDAKEARDRINESIMGLPIGLNESAQRLRKYQMYLDDIDRATNLTIGAQWAITAGGADATYQRQAYNQIDYMLTAGKLNRITQWRSLMNGLGVSTKFLREEMGYANLTNAQFTDQLSHGKITVDEFIKGLERLASSDGGIKDALAIYKDTLGAWINSIDFAIQRGGETVTKALNTLSEDIFGQDLTDLAETFRNKVDDIFLDMADYIDRNPELFSRLADSIEGLFGVFGKFDFERIADLTLGNLADVIDVITDAIDRLDPAAAEEFVAFATTWAGPLSEVISAISSGLPGLMAVFDRLREFDWAGFTTTVLDHVENAFNRIANFLDMLPDGFAQNLLAFAIVDAPILEKVFHGIGRIIGAIASVAVPVIAITKLGIIGKILKKIGGIFKGSNAGALLDAKSFFTGIGGAAAFVLLIAEIGLVVRELAWVAQSISDLDISDNFESNLQKVKDMFSFATVWAGLFTAIGTVVSAAGLGPIAGIGELLAGGLTTIILGIAEATKLFAEGAKTIGEIDLTGYDGKVSASIEAMKNIISSLASETVDSGQASLAAKNIDEAVQHFVSIKESLEQLKDIDTIDIDFDAVTTALTNAYSLVDEVNKAAGDKWVVDAKNNDSAIYEQYLTNMADSMEQISRLAGFMKTAKQHMDEFGVNMTDLSAKSDWENFKTSLKQAVTFTKDIFGTLETFASSGTALKHSGNYAGVLTNMASAFENLMPIFDAFRDVRLEMNKMGMYTGQDGMLEANSPWDKFKTRLDDVVEFIGSIYGKFEDKFPEVKNPKSEKDNIFGGNIAENINDIVTNSSTMFSELKQTLGFMKVLGEDLGQLDGKYVLGKGRVSLGEQLNTLAGQIDTMFESIGTVIDTVKKYEGKSESAATAATNITNMSQSLEDIFTNLGELDALLEEHPQSVYTSDLAKVNNIMPTLGTLVETIAGFTMAGDVATKAEKLKETTGYVMGALQAIAQKSKMITNISENKLGEKVKTAIDEMMKGFKAFPENMDDVQKNASNFETAATSIINGVQAMKDNMEMIEEVAGGETALNLGQILFDMLSAVMGSFDLGTISTIASNLNEAINGLVETMSTLSTTDLSGLMESLGNLGESVDGVKDKLLELQTQLQHTQTGCYNLKSAVESLANMMDSKGGNLDTFKSHLDYVRNAANNAATQVNRLRSAIDALHDKEITVKTTFLQTGGAVPAQNFARYRWRHATGGMIYAASGFHKRGTDVVPAMLTPGEFVMRRAAVQKFGAGFMARLNSLNLDGALQLLYSARRLPQTVSSVINNARSYDNHATVNQNIYTNNQNYSHRRAYRYLRTV